MSLDNLLSAFDKAIRERDADTMAQLFMAPDATADGRNRASHLDEMFKDWKTQSALIPSNLTPRHAVIRIEMQDDDPHGPPGGHVTEIELNVHLTDNGWRIASLR